MTGPQINPAPNIHNPPAEVKQVPRLTTRQVGVVGEIIVELILAKIALALAGVNILGLKPFDFMNQWAIDLQNKASDAYKGAFVIVDVRAGNSLGTTNSGTLSQIYTAQAQVNSTANTASSNASSGLNQIGQIISGVGTSIVGAVVNTATAVGQAIGGAIQGVVDTWNGFWGAVFGGTHTGKTATDFRTAAGSVTATANTAYSTGNTNADNTKTVVNGIYDAWFGGGGTGAVAQAQTTIAAIKTKIESGYTLETLTYNQAGAVQIATISGAPTGGTFRLSYGPQVVTVTGSPTGGSFNLTLTGATTSTVSIAYNASAATVQSALTSAASALGAGSVTVTGANGGPWTITFTYPLPLTLSSTSFTGGTSPSVSIPTTVTSTIAYNATAATVQTALTGLSSVGSGKATVTGSAGGPYTVTLDSSLSPYKTLGGNGASLTGGSLPAITMSAQGTWTRPFTVAAAPKEFYVIAYGSGGGGGAGQRTVNSTPTPGAGGSAGGYFALQIDAATLPSTVTYTVAAGGLGRTSSSTTATPSAESSFGSYLVTSVGSQAVANLLGYYATPESGPGAGGTGGYLGDGIAGGTTRLAAGGAGGKTANIAQSATAGGNGAIASLVGTVRSGGGGGGGGGGSVTSSFTSFDGGDAQLGGNGGFPGGGAGGGGGMNDGWSKGRVAGNGGNGAHGVIVLLWK